MPTVYINDKPVEIGASEKLNCIQAAQRADVEIPSYCWHPALTVVASCRMCLIELGDKKPDGTIAMQPKLFPGCQTPVKDGTVVVTNSAKVKEAQKATLEYLLLNHPLDCPTCDQAGECYLQDFSYKYGRGYSRLNEPKTLKPDKDYIGDEITLFTDRCIMCTRCVRFTREISGTAELQVISRGSVEEIDIFPGEPCNNKLAGNVVDLCPVGALCSKDFLYKQRVWWLHSKPSVCPDCSTGCSIHVDQNEDRLYRLRPRYNPQAQGHFMCDDGRFGWKYIHSDQRLSSPAARRDGQVTSNHWDEILPAVRNAIQTFTGRLGAVISPWSTVEEAYMLAKWLKQHLPDVVLAMGPVRTEGSDDQYPKTVTGTPPAQVKFTIHAEKAPNRRGVEMVLKHFQDRLLTFDDAAQKVERRELDGLFLLNADPHAVFGERFIADCANLKLLIVEDLLASSLSDAAGYVLAGAAWAEKDGTFVNYKNLAQPIVRALRGPADARPDGRILWDLSGRTGLFRAATVRQEIASEIPEFAPLILGDLGDQGVSLTPDAAPAPQKQLQPA